MKKFLCLFLAVLFCVLAVSCTQSGDGETKTTTTTTKKDPGTGGESTTESTKSSETTKTPDIPPVLTPDNKNISAAVGDNVTVVYNKAYCTVESSAEAGVGSKENVTLKITMNDGYIFDGWSVGGVISNGSLVAESSETYAFEASDEMTVYANYSVSVVYHVNGGSTKNGNDTYTQHFSAVMYKCPNTLPEQGYFTREGYTLLEYNTKADGTGEGISLGSRVPMNEKPSVELYCIWEKQNAETDFEYEITASNKKAKITGYKGDATEVIIPDTLGGATVYAITENAFEGKMITRVVLSKNVVLVEKNAFKDCASLVTFVMFDSLMSISDESFSGAPLKNLRVNAVLNLYNDWMTNSANGKVDRVLWAKNYDKIIIYGGSGSLNGFNCSEIDKALYYEYEIINLGSNANVSASLYFEFLQEYMKEDDILLWSPEMGSYMLGSTRFTNRTWEFQAGHYDIFRYVDISGYTNVFRNYSNYAANHANKQKAWDKYSTDVDEYGDAKNVRVHEEATYTYDFVSNVEGIKIYTSRAKDIIANLNKNGVKTFLTFAAMDAEGKGYGDEIVEKYLSFITEIMPGLEVISDYKDYLVPHEYMSDSAWHLTLEGADYRTEKIIADLKVKLGL